MILLKNKEYTYKEVAPYIEIALKEKQIKRSDFLKYDTKIRLKKSIDVSVNVREVHSSDTRCPKCKKEGNIAGLMSSFWVQLDSDGHPSGQWRDWEDDTELDFARLCGCCGHEWTR